MSSADLTVIICARDAAATIGGAIDSVLADDGVCPILLVDDYSEDGTARIARDHGGDRVSVIRPMRRLGLGNARSEGIERVQTPFAAWLDADDAFLPGRVGRLLSKLKSGADIVFDAAELFDGATGAFKRVLEMPPFMLEKGAIIRGFERNYLPGSAWPGVNVAFARKVGYDPALRAAEDTDFILRSIVSGARVAILPEVGYRQYHYSDSISRDLEGQREAVAGVLRKHDYEQVEGLYRSCGFNRRLSSWGLCSMAIFREDYAAARRFLGDGYPSGADPHEILDPGGPLPVEEGWKHAFFRGTLELLDGGSDGISWLSEAEAMRPTPEGANNLGVAYSRAGRKAEAESQFSVAASRLEGYIDALKNLKSTEAPVGITTHPLRLQASRSDYAV